MNLSLLIFCYCMVLHFLGDFVFQTHWMATNKSKNIEALLAHIIVYTLILSLGLKIIFSQTDLVGISSFIFLAHFVTDYFTSKWTSKLWAAQNWHLFFVIIGLDQLLHYAQLLFVALLLTS